MCVCACVFVCVCVCLFVFHLMNKTVGLKKTEKDEALCRYSVTASATVIIQMLLTGYLITALMVWQLWSYSSGHTYTAVSIVPHTCTAIVSHTCTATVPRVQL